MAEPTTQFAHQHRGRPIPNWVLVVLSTLEDLVYLGVALVLLGVAIAALYQTVQSLVTSHQSFATSVTTAVNGVLFVVIVLEVFRTLLAHMSGGGFQLRPFLIIGIISVVRHILLVGAQSVNGGNTGFDHVQIELGVNAGVALVLVIALVLLHRSGATSDLENNG
jgi:uncharacterized membrane protein (DUF373 family)